MNTPEQGGADVAREPWSGGVNGAGADRLAALDDLVDRAGTVLAGLLPGDLSRAMLTRFVSTVEKLGRLADAARIAGAGEAAERSRTELGGEGLASTLGCRNANELLQRLTGVSAQTAGKRLALGRETYRRATVTGFAPARFPSIADALAAGALTSDAAAVIVRGLSPVIGRCSHDLWAGAEQELVAAAADCTADETRIQAEIWRAALDPDGAEPTEQQAMRRRSMCLRQDAEGMMRLTGLLMPTAAAQLTKLLDAYLTPRTQPAFRSADEGASVEEVNDPRSRDQQRHDIFAGLVDVIARSGDGPTIGGAAPTVLVTVSETEWNRAGVEGVAGVGAVEGVEVPVSLKTVRQYACTGGVQPVVLDAAGAIIALGSPQRCFTPQQRRAITVRDGGCLIPGCLVPASWCEIHHVHEAALGGPTHTSNGVLLCWFHHRTIDTSGWKVRMRGGVPQIKPPPWPHPDPPWRAVTKSRTRLTDSIRRAPRGP